MRVKESLPEQEIQVVRVKDTEKTSMFKVFLLRPNEVGEAQYNRERRVWVTSDGTAIQGMSEVENYYRRVVTREGLPLEEGIYRVDGMTGLSQAPDRVVIHLKTGGQIVINTK